MRLTIITINHNSSENTIKLLESLKNQTDKDFEVVVVDNNSDDLEKLMDYKTSETNIIYIKNDRNLGYSGGNNVGICRALENGANWVLLLNNDTWVESSFIEQLKANLEGRDGIIGLALDEGGQIAYAGKIEWFKPTLKHAYNSDFVSQNCHYYAVGGAMLIHKDVFGKIGLLDENYFLYFEDADFCQRARKAGIPITFITKIKISHSVSSSTKKLGSSLLLRYHYRNSLYFNLKNGPWYIKLLLWPWGWLVSGKQIVKILAGKNKEQSLAILKGVRDWYTGRMGKLPACRQAGMIKRIGIECESIENDTWGVARLTSKLLEEIDKRPYLQKEFKFCLYFKSKIPDCPYLKNPIFEKKTVKPPFIPPSFSLYYYVYLPIFLWFKRVNLMFFPNYMLPLIFLGKSVVMLTDDIHYESRNPKLPFRYRLAYRIFAGWAAGHASQIMAISETSKKELARLFGIKPQRITVNHLGVDSPSVQGKNDDHKYVLYVGQAFPRRHLRETILAFQKLAPEFPELQLIAIGHDKYDPPVIKNLVSEVNSKLNREAVVHKNHVKEEELAKLYSGAKALIYVSNREAFGLPPMEALSLGVPPVIADNELGHELFGDYAFYVSGPNPDEIAESIRQALTDSEKISKIKNFGPEFVKKYTWNKFTDKWLEIIRSLNE